MCNIKLFFKQLLILFRLNFKVKTKTLIKILIFYVYNYLKNPIIIMTLLIQFFYKISFLGENPLKKQLMFDSQSCVKFVEKLFDESALPSLQKYIEIPNLSRTFDPQWNTNGRLLEAATHIKSWVEGIKIEGLSSQIHHDQGFSPLIYTQIKGDLPQTVLFYGHFDKQPPFQGWLEGFGATKPVIKQGKLYGRGGADDGYSTYGTMLAIKAVQQQKIKLPRCVMITEGDEQSGSGHTIDHYLPKLKQKIGNPKIVFCLDSGTLDYDRLWLSTSLRGNLVGTLKVSTMRDGVHSGDSSGVVPNCFRIVKQLLARIQNPVTGQFHPAFKVDVPAQYYKQNYDLSKIKPDSVVSGFPFLEGCKPITPNPLNQLLNKTWQPTLTITGQTGFPQAEGSGNVNHPCIQIRFSIRLPPTLNGHQAAKKLQQILLSNPPYHAKVELYDVRAGFGWISPKFDKFLTDAIQQSSEIFYKQKILNFGEGGSIPLMNSLSASWPQAQFLITGVLGPNSNAHGPNEFLELNYTKKLICCMAYILAKSSLNFSQKK